MKSCLAVFFGTLLAIVAAFFIYGFFANESAWEDQKFVDVHNLESKKRYLEMKRRDVLADPSNTYDSDELKIAQEEVYNAETTISSLYRRKISALSADESSQLIDCQSEITEYEKNHRVK